MGVTSLVHKCSVRFLVEESQITVDLLTVCGDVGGSVVCPIQMLIPTNVVPKCLHNITKCIPI